MFIITTASIACGQETDTPQPVEPPAPNPTVEANSPTVPPPTSPTSAPATNAPSSNDPPSPTTPLRDSSIQELLEATNAAMRAVESAHLVYEATTEVGNKVSLFVGIEGDYQAPDRFRYSMASGFGPGSGTFRSEYTLIGSRGFLKDPESGLWQPDPASQNP